MAQNLTEDLNIVANSNLEIELLDGDLNIIQKLDDEPNDVGGLTSAELKAKFDEAGNVIKTYINDTLIPAILAEDATEEARASAEAARETAEQARASAEAARETAEQARVEAENGRVSAEAARVTAEQERAAAEQARADENTGIVAQATAQAEAAAASASEAAGYKASAQKYAGDAEYYAQNMRSEVTRAAAYASDASKSATAASASETAAKASETAAAASAKAAADSAARAEEVVGGDFATRTELSAHTGNADIHVTAEEKAAWNESDVFIATYGTTTNAEISAACDAGKVVLCKKNGDTRIARLLLDNGVVHMFDAALYNSYTIWMCSRGNWSELTYYYTPSSHASTHASGGSDPITPESIGAATAYTYGTEDLTAGTSTLETGKLYFVYE